MNIQLSSDTVRGFINSQTTQPVVFDNDVYTENLHVGFHVKAIESARVTDTRITFVCSVSVSVFGHEFAKLEVTVPAQAVVALINQKVGQAKHGGLNPDEKTIYYADTRWGAGIGAMEGYCG